MLRINEGRGAAHLLRLGHHLQGQRRLTGGFRAIDFDNAAAWQAPDTQGHVQPDGTGGNRFDIAHRAGIAHAHDRSLTKLLFDLSQRHGEGFVFVVFSCCGHCCSPECSDC